MTRVRLTHTNLIKTVGCGGARGAVAPTTKGTHGKQPPLYSPPPPSPGGRCLLHFSPVARPSLAPAVTRSVVHHRASAAAVRLARPGASMAPGRHERLRGARGGHRRHRDRNRGPPERQREPGRVVVARGGSAPDAEGGACGSFRSEWCDVVRRTSNQRDDEKEGRREQPLYRDDDGDDNPAMLSCVGFRLDPSLGKVTTSKHQNLKPGASRRRRPAARPSARGVVGRAADATPRHA